MPSESASNVWCCFSPSLDAQVKESRDGNGGGTLIVIPSDPLEKSLLPISTAGPYLVPKGGMLLPEDTTMIPLNRVKATAPLLCVPHAKDSPLNQQAKKGVTVWLR